MILAGCSDPAMLPIVSVIVKIFQLVQILGPILAIVSLMILFFRLMVTPQDPDDPKKDNWRIKHSIKNAFIALILLFLIPTLVDLTMTVMGESFSVSSCWQAAKNYKASNTTEYKPRSNHKNKTKVVNDKKYSEGSTTSATTGAAGMAEAFVNLAVSQKGASSRGGKKYLNYMNESSGAWCSEFVSWCIGNTKNNGENMSKYFSYKAKGNTEFIKHCKNSNDCTWHSASSSYTPKKGDLIFFDWDRNGVSNHIGIVQSVNGKKIKTVEGNCGNKVCERNTKTTAKNIFGYCSWY